MITKLVLTCVLFDVIICLNVTKNTNFLHKHSTNKIIETNRLSLVNHSIIKSGNKYTSKIDNSKKIQISSTIRPKIKVYRLNNSLVKHFRINKTNDGKENSKISLKNMNVINRHYKNQHQQWTSEERNLLKTREKPFLNGDAQNLKHNQTIGFLSNINFYLMKLQKESDYLEANYKGFGKKFFYLVKYKLKNAYEELRLNLCNNVLDPDDEFDEDYSDLERETSNYMNSNNIIEKMKRNERRRTIRAKNEKRFIRKFCN